jgi:hypothetical protein
MAEDKPRNRPRREPDPEIAGAEGLFRGDSALKPKHVPEHMITPGSASNEVFDLAESPSSDDLPPLSPVAPGTGAGPTSQSRQPRDRKTDAVVDQAQLDPAALVPEVWSRQAEWGPTLILVGSWVAFILLFACYGLGAEYFWYAMLTVLVGAIVAAILSYPIWITLERPVRITPEQAVRDYYGSLSHHFPHFRRMWLLLSSAGRISNAFGSYEGFKAYWKDRVRLMREGHAGSFTPLVFEIGDFRAEKSAGKVRIDTEFNLKVWVRGKRRAGAIHAIPMKIALVRGPDRMWYLEDGTLGREGKTGKPAISPHS